MQQHNQETNCTSKTFTSAHSYVFGATRRKLFPLAPMREKRPARRLEANACDLMTKDSSERAINRKAIAVEPAQFHEAPDIRPKPSMASGPIQFACDPAKHLVSTYGEPGESLLSASNLAFIRGSANLEDVPASGQNGYAQRSIC